MKRFTLSRWIAVPMLAIALASGAASAQEDGMVTISGSLSMDYGGGDLPYELLAVYASGQEHTWTLTLHGTTQSHSTNGSYYATDIDATSFDLEFFGPDADTLNGVVSDYLAGGDVYVTLQNTYYVNGGGLAWMQVTVWGRASGMYFYTGHDIGVDTLFPTDADGFPVVGPEPFSIETDYTELGYFDLYSGGGAIGSLGGLVTLEGSVGEPDPQEPVLLAATDASVVEGDRGSRTVAVAVTLSHASSQAISVSYQTVDGTADARRDYTGTSGTLTFQPGQISRTISISIKGDRKREADETFFVQLSNAAGATIADGVATVTILNDD